MENVERIEEGRKAERKALGDITNRAPGDVVARMRRKPSDGAASKRIDDAKRRRIREVAEFNNGELYSADIYKYLHLLERKHSLKSDFLAGSCITERMRQVVIDWLLDVQIHFKLDLETVELTVAILDRYLVQESSVDRTNVQLVALAALFVAVKYHETFLLDLSDLRYVCDSAFTGDEILNMERLVLKKIDFNLCYPSRSAFLRRLVGVTTVDEKFAFYLLDVSLLEASLASEESSKIAAACVYIALCAAASSTVSWSLSLTSFSSYTLLDLQNPLTALARKCASSARIDKGGIFNKHLKHNRSLTDLVRNPCYLETLTLISTMFDSESSLLTLP